MMADNSSEMASVAVVQQVYDAFARGDMATFAALMAEDVHWLEAENYPYADGNPYRSADAIINGVFARVASDWSSFDVVVETTEPVGENKVLVLGRYKGVARITGKSIDAQVAHLWEVSDARIGRFQQFADTLQVANALRP